MRKESVIKDFLSGKHTLKEIAIMNNCFDSHVSKIVSNYFYAKKRSLKRVPMTIPEVQPFEITEEEMLRHKPVGFDQDIIKRFNKTTYKKDDFKTRLNNAL